VTAEGATLKLLARRRWGGGVGEWEAEVGWELVPLSFLSRSDELLASSHELG